MYRKIDYMGNTAYSDRYIQMGGIVYMLSLFGTPDLVKAISSALMNKQEIRIEEENEIFSPLARSLTNKYTVMQKKVYPGVNHCIIYQKDILSIQDIQSVAVIIEPTPDKLYDLLDAKYPTPLLPDWKYELYDMFVTHSPNTMQLRTLGYDSAVEIELPSQEELESKVLDIVSSEPLAKAS